MCDSIVNLIIDLIRDKYVNPYQGSVCIEKITSILNDKYNNLFTLEIKPKYKNFTRFIQEYPQYFILLENNKIALVDNIHYEYADKIHESDKKRLDHYLKNEIVSYLTKYNTCNPNDLMSNINVEIKRGDLVRFIKRHPTIFTFNNNTFMVSFHRNFNIDEHNKLNDEKNISIYKNYISMYENYNYDSYVYNNYVTNECYSYENHNSYLNAPHNYYTYENNNYYHNSN